VAGSGCWGHQGIGFFLISWATIVIAFALLLGFVNVITVHLNRIRGRKPGAIYSGVLLASLLGTLLFGIAGPTSPNTQFIFEYILQPLEATFLPCWPYLSPRLRFALFASATSKHSFLFYLR